ncbi:MAG: hypothetical protein K0R94_335 [Burkholderiales bacterium]|jgi:biotin carboxylase|nr:hypothetical protein [Burkholderiales bacterium]
MIYLKGSSALNNFYHILLVNPFASARYLSNELRKYAIKTTALYTKDISLLSDFLKPDINLFDEQVFCLSTDIEDIIKQLNGKTFSFVLNGFEGSVKTADILAKYYTPKYANNPDTAMLRSSKDEIHKALAKNNFSHIRQFLYNCNDQLPDLAKLGLAYPCFVKPLAANGSTGASKINNPSDLEKYFYTDRLTFNNMCETEETRDKFLISEFIEGTEITVDTFSRGGKHYISSIQQYSKEYFKSKPVFRSSEVVQNSNLIQKISDYIFQILDTAQLYNGFAHTEIFLTPRGELKLIEINPRIAGTSGMTNTIAKLSGRTSQIDLLLEYQFNIQPETIKDNMQSRILSLYNFGGNALYNLKQQLAKWDSVYEVNQLVPDGHIQSNGALALTDAIAFVIIVAQDMKILNQHTDEILAQDRLGWTLK